MKVIIMKATISIIWIVLLYINWQDNKKHAAELKQFEVKLDSLYQNVKQNSNYLHAIKKSDTTEDQQHKK
jgi:hypothetical protein